MAIVFVAVGSLLGEWAGHRRRWLGPLWFWFGNQGWEFLEIGRAWQILLAIGLVFWFWLVVAQSWRPRDRDPERRGLVNFFLIAAAAIPVFYLPALFFDGATHYTIVDTWRFWIIHLWVEGFFELFVTVIVAVIFYQLGLVERNTALRAIYLDVILVFGGGLIGTGHHWYFTGQTDVQHGTVLGVLGAGSGAAHAVDPRCLGLRQASLAAARRATTIPRINGPSTS